MTLHAKDFPPSSAKRWLRCPGSVSLIRSLPEHMTRDTGNYYAQEGSAAHKLAELMATGLWPDLAKHDCVYVPEWDKIFPVGDKQLSKTEAPTIPIDAAMIDHVEGYVAYCRAIPGEASYENRVDFSAYIPNGFGTSDCIVMDTASHTLHIVDLKYGQGVMVSAEDNPQLMLYALGSYLMYCDFVDIKKVVMHIHMPRRDYVGTSECSVDELLEFAEYAKTQAAAAELPDAPLAPDEDACRWCLAAPMCPALAEEALCVAVRDFGAVEDVVQLVDKSGAEAVDLVETKLLDENALSCVLSLAPLLETWLKATREHAYNVLLESGGVGLPGFKLVEGRANRKWVDADRAAARLRDQLYTDEELYTRSFVSPAQAEKLIGKKNAGQIADLITTPEGKPVMAPEGDPRPPANIRRGEEFNDKP